MLTEYDAGAVLPLRARGIDLLVAEIKEGVELSVARPSN